jgi:N-acetylglucosaminyldiphosphoundecaprenol N-acetyl-beta-D-mannosaminyltransferase
LLDKRLRHAYSNAALVVPDGMPLVRILQLRGVLEASRVYGPDLVLASCKRFQSHGYRHFFYGGAPGIADRLVARLKTLCPKIQIAGTWNPPFRRLTRAEDVEIVQRINDSGADILWVALGAPKQEEWIAEHRPLLSVPVLIGVGYAFDAVSGAKPQAPLWMRQAGFEWAFRFACEPGRLWPRIFIDPFLFLIALNGQIIGLRRLLPEKQISDRVNIAVGEKSPTLSPLSCRSS